MLFVIKFSDAPVSEGLQTGDSHLGIKSCVCVGDRDLCAGSYDRQLLDGPQLLHYPPEFLTGLFVLARFDHISYIVYLHLKFL